ncbi:L-2-hydroxyglutarate oxidase [Marinomonas posidonica]|uniref:FAD dependent oxidoreductase n=1 Tax=Marinomonas posidonica (strain CECT 7376 / NCIMB 14433 / IVIA-Po-181) TaxID=491952 RepID=F6CW22_MARPP|nr:L-2-hydroxyglutarate oxidase [Marinomonas posidonica]AEF54321.1 FAD dependent oxidoreductase [Marinomonas posidonica IVIA-Po-181]
MSREPIYDIAVIGAGIVGLSTAWQLQKRYPKYRILLIEKESEVGLHQTGHNSGVIHAGVYYVPGSLKAEFCYRGAKDTKTFCREHSIEFEECGKLLVATNEVEYDRMLLLYKRCRENSLKVELLDQAELNRREPNVKGIAAIYVPSTGIVNYQKICQKLAELFDHAGGALMLESEVVDLKEHASYVDIKLKNAQVQASFLVSCGGLMADRLTKMLKIPTDFQIIPFRGEYYQLPPQHNNIVKHLIYPIPDPDLPFLGVHLTRMIDGSVTVGPNAVQGWKREGYGRINFSIKDVAEMVTFVGFWRLLKTYWKTGLIETKNSWFKAGYLQQVQKYCDLVELEDLQPYPAGIRAQAVMKDGSLVHDFLFASSERTLHVCNAPSPAATSAFPIGQYIVNKLDDQITTL